MFQISNSSSLKANIAIRIFSKQEHFFYSTGLSDKNVYILSDGRKRPEGSPEFRDKVEFKNDDALELATKDNGMIFNLANFDALETKGRKAFTVTLSAAIADQVSRTEQKLECMCTLKHSLFPEQICYVKDTQILPPVSI